MNLFVAMAWGKCIEISYNSIIRKISNFGDYKFLKGYITINSAGYFYRVLFDGDINDK